MKGMGMGNNKNEIFSFTLHCIIRYWSTLNSIRDEKNTKVTFGPSLNQCEQQDSVVINYTF